MRYSDWKGYGLQRFRPPSSVLRAAPARCAGVASILVPGAAVVSFVDITQRLRFMRLQLPIVAIFVFSTVSAAPPPDDRGVDGRNGVVVCTSATACDAGASVLARGGTAVDAAVATAFALAVTHPSAGNIGGGGFMIVRTRDGHATAFDYRERAPMRATREMY